MVNTFALVVLATFVLSSHARVWNLEVTTYGDDKCDFSFWNDITPAYGHTCVRMYKTWTWWKAPYPWCYQNGGSWDYCSTYTWNVEYPEDRHMIKSQSRRKQYYFNYYQTGTYYEDARKICQSKGSGWDVASFQAVPSFKNSDYDKAVLNIKEALSPLIETWDAFWVKKSNSNVHCLDFNKYRTNVDSQICFMSDDFVLDKCTIENFVQRANCANKRTFVCEKDLE